MVNGVPDALTAALVFGASTPLAKRLGDGVNPLVMAGLLYLGCGVGLSASLAAWRSQQSKIRRSDTQALLGIVVFGGMLAPVLLMTGLRTTPSATASLLLNLEAVFTALGAWVFAREHADRRIVIGMVVIVAGGVLLTFQPDGGFGFTSGAFAIIGACLCWGIDNVVTRPLAVRDPRQIAAVKGLVAGAVNLAMGLTVGGGHLPGVARTLGAMATGLVGYGISLVLYVRAVRQLGTARTGAYYAAAPFVGAAIGLIWLREPVAWSFVPALLLMLIGLGIHITETHVHMHTHVALQHAHGHHHDEHHVHPDTVDSAEAFPRHELEHAHEPLAHDHRHTPDPHHRHDH